MFIIGIFLDTGFYIGLSHPKDKFAEDSNRILKSLAKGDHGLLYTSLFIISEATTLVAVRSNKSMKVFNTFEKKIWGKDKLAINLPFDSELECKTWELFKKVNTTDFKDVRPMSFVDVSTLILCQQHSIDKIVSFDSHFDRFLERIF